MRQGWQGNHQLENQTFSFKTSLKKKNNCITSQGIDIFVMLADAQHNRWSELIKTKKYPALID